MTDLYSLIGGRIINGTTVQLKAEHLFVLKTKL